MKSLFDNFRRLPLEQPMSRLLAIEAAMPLNDAARTVRDSRLGANPVLAPLLPHPPGHATGVLPLTSIEKSIILSVAFGEAGTTHRRRGYHRHDMYPYRKIIRAKLGAHTLRWGELVYRAVTHEEIPPSLPPRTEVNLGRRLLWVISGIAAGQRPEHLSALLGIDGPEWSELEKQLLKAVGARSTPHAIYLCVRLIPWPWTTEGEWDAPGEIPVRSH